MSFEFDRCTLNVKRNREFPIISGSDGWINDLFSLKCSQIESSRQISTVKHLYFSLSRNLSSMKIRFLSMEMLGF